MSPFVSFMFYIFPGSVNLLSMAFKRSGKTICNTSKTRSIYARQKYLFLSASERSSSQSLSNAVPWIILNVSFSVFCATIAEHWGLAGHLVPQRFQSVVLFFMRSIGSCVKLDIMLRSRLKVFIPSSSGRLTAVYQGGSCSAILRIPE